jgi:hypothetical protein
VSGTEAEEEFLTNKVGCVHFWCYYCNRVALYSQKATLNVGLCGTAQLIKRMEELKEEKEKLAVDIMREEEFLTNTLQRKLAQVRWFARHWR